MSHNFRNLKIWQEGIEFVDQVYDLCQSLPKEERFNLVSQMQRSAISIPSNIAEGSAKKSKREFAHFLGIALGSSYEIETQLVICKRREYNVSKSEQLILHIQEIQKMIYGLRSTLKIFILSSLFFTL